MNPFTDYKTAHKAAAKKANELNRDVGIEKAREFGKTVYRVAPLPNKENRSGWELSCEVVSPGTPVSEARKLVSCLLGEATECIRCKGECPDGSGTCEKCCEKKPKKSKGPFPPLM